MTESWKNILGFSNYQVSNTGKIKNINTGRILKPALNGSGYLTCSLSEKGKTCSKKIHRLVAEYFVPNYKDSPEVNHKDGDKLNNSASNLEWVTRAQNMQHACDTKLIQHAKGEAHYKSSLTQEQVTWIRENYIPRDPLFGSTALAKRFDISQSAISNIIHNKSWKM